jgi:hypothetical protein
VDEQTKSYFENLTLSKKVIFILKSHDEIGGPQSMDQINKILNMKKKNLESMVSKLCLARKIERVSPGVYRYPGDKREPKD